MMLTARLKSCAAAAVVLAACLLLPNTPAKAEAVSLPEPEQTAAEQPAPKPAPASAVLTPLAYEATVTEILEEPAEEPEEEAPAEEAEEAEEETVDDSPIAQATKADMQRPDDLVKLGDFIATAYCVTGQTSTGTQTTVGRTLAVNPYVIPYGTEVWLYLADGTFAGDFIAEDTGSNMLENPNVIDIYMGQGSYNDCILWGAQNVQVYIRATAESDAAQNAQ
mgnify:FL=1